MSKSDIIKECHRLLDRAEIIFSEMLECIDKTNEGWNGKIPKGDA